MCSVVANSRCFLLKHRKAENHRRNGARSCDAASRRPHEPTASLCWRRSSCCSSASEHETRGSTSSLGATGAAHFSQQTACCTQLHSHVWKTAAHARTACALALKIHLFIGGSFKNNIILENILFYGIVCFKLILSTHSCIPDTFLQLITKRAFELNVLKHDHLQL